MLESTVNLNTFSIRDEAGNVDVEKTAAKFSAYLVTFSASVKADNETIRTLIDAVYSMPGNSDKECLPVTYIVGNVANKLKVDDSLAAFDVATERVESFIKESGLFGSRKGPKGGLFRVKAAEAPKAEQAA